jgi:hypothetical protein
MAVPPKTPEEQARDAAELVRPAQEAARAAPKAADAEPEKSLAAPPEAPPPPVVETRKPWRGSRVTYGQTVAPLSLFPNAQPWYDPSWAHHLTLEPELHFNDFVYVRARLFIAQELTQSDTTSAPYLPGWSDLYLYGGWSGYEEPHTRLKLFGDLMVTLPASPASQYRSEILRVGPRAALSRTFNVLAGVTVGYGARPVFHVNRLAVSPQCFTPQCSGATGGFGSNAGVAFDSGPDTAFTQSTGGRNVFFHISHGPFVAFRPHATVSLDASFWFDNGWLYSLAQPPPQFQSTTQVYGSGLDRKDQTRFLLSASWQFTRPVGVTLSAFTAGGALAADGTYIFPLFNRYTQLNLDLTLDIEGLTSLVL